MVRTIAILLTAVSAVPITIVPVILLFITFGALRWYYLKSARDIKRLEAIGTVQFTRPDTFSLFFSLQIEVLCTHTCL